MKLIKIKFTPNAHIYHPFVHGTVFEAIEHSRGAVVIAEQGHVHPGILSVSKDDYEVVEEQQVEKTKPFVSLRDLIGQDMQNVEVRFK